MEGLVISSAAWRGRSVLVTGHTGFKGGWLAIWLNQLGAEVHGLALDPPGDPNLFEAASVAEALTSDSRVDLADLDSVERVVEHARPSVVFHLAAQPLVLRGYEDPVGTWRTNVLGTVHLLEAVRHSPTVRTVVIATTDKVYENEETGRPFIEGDRLGGHDPYAASKAATELVVSSARASFPTTDHGGELRLATGRAGNVIGGGDWALDRLVPDCLRAASGEVSLRIRNPGSIRPWQHVLDPLSGYLRLAETLDRTDGGNFCGAWNFGPDEDQQATVGEVVDEVFRVWGSRPSIVTAEAEQSVAESRLLALNSSRAKALLGWLPRWNMSEAVALTVRWHRAWTGADDMGALCRHQIAMHQDCRSG
jgi:CDP-glucose 4,6-dehydratase